MKEIAKGERREQKPSNIYLRAYFLWQAVHYLPAARDSRDYPHAGWHLLIQEVEPSQNFPRLTDAGNKEPAWLPPRGSNPAEHFTFYVCHLWIGPRLHMTFPSTQFHSPTTAGITTLLPETLSKEPILGQSHSVFASQKPDLQQS